MKKFCLFTTCILSIFFGSFVHAQQCGSGNIVDIKEGGWDTDDFMIRLKGPNAHADSLFHGFVRFSSANLSASRIEAIRRLATTAFALDATVWTYSHNGSCTSATEISVRQ